MPAPLCLLTYAEQARRRALSTFCCIPSPLVGIGLRRGAYEILRLQRAWFHGTSKGQRWATPMYYEHHRQSYIRVKTMVYLERPDSNATGGVISFPSESRAFSMSKIATRWAIASQMLVSAKRRPGQILSHAPLRSTCMRLGLRSLLAFDQIRKLRCEGRSGPILLWTRFRTARA